MKLYYSSPCSQCYYTNKCHPSHKSYRIAKIERANQGIQSMSDTDCFKSPERILRDFNNMPDWKQQVVTQHKKRYCFGNCLQYSECATCHAYDECVFITNRSSEK